MKKPIQKVAAIHDLSGFGRSSLTVVLPILSSMQLQVCPLPTAVLSTQTGFENFHFVDLTEHMSPIIEHWKKLKIDFDAIYSGFLGSHKQIEIVKDFIKHFKTDKQLVVIDPVLGDHGKLYGPLGDDMVNEMKSLITHADIITPNLTEASLLLEKPYNQDISEEEVKKWAKELSERGPKIVIITSVPEQNFKKRTSVIAYTKKDDRFWKVSCDYIPASFPGTGDAFTSVIVGSLLQGDSLPMALDRAVQFTSMAIRATFGHDYDYREGIMLEKILNNLNAPVQMSSYELLS